MHQPHPQFTAPMQCPLCGHTAPMSVAAHHLQWYNSEWGEVWRLLVCPACKRVLVATMWWDAEEEEIKIVFPVRNTRVAGLPSDVQCTYEKALKVRGIDGNAFAVLLGRVLDQVCIERGAAGKSLSERISRLAASGEIPPRLADMAHQLRQLRNIGAHADLGELTSKEVPILDDLCSAILTYVYTGPFLVDQVEQHLHQLRNGTDSLSSRGSEAAQQSDAGDGGPGILSQ